MGAFIKVTALESSKTLVNTHCMKISLDVVEGTYKMKRPKPRLPRARGDNSHNYLHLKADWEIGPGTST